MASPRATVETARNVASQASGVLAGVVGFGDPRSSSELTRRTDPPSWPPHQVHPQMESTNRHW